VIHVTFRPLSAWPHPATRPRRIRPFSASFQATLDLLDRELRHLKASGVILAAGFREQDLRMDGWPKSGAPQPSHPGVELSFESRHGRLVYATDACLQWQDNVRSLALGLEALRAVDRFAITRRGEQYAGWKQLPSGIAPDPAMTLERAWSIFEESSGYPREDIEYIGLDLIWRDVAKATHPDAEGGDGERFVQAKAAYDYLKAVAS
jgi:hypothetical protein